MRSKIRQSRLARQLKRSRAKSIVVLLDCCFSGSFPAGLDPRNQRAVDLHDLTGQGCVVITASSSLEYAFEGDRVVDSDPSASIFTEAVVTGLRSGRADVDRDGIVSSQDLFDYVQDAIRASGAPQTPTLHTDGLQGQIAVAYAPLPVADPLTEPDRPAGKSNSAVSLEVGMSSFLDELEDANARSISDTLTTIPSGFMILTGQHPALRRATLFWLAVFAG